MPYCDVISSHLDILYYILQKIKMRLASISSSFAQGTCNRRSQIPVVAISRLQTGIIGITAETTFVCHHWNMWCLRLWWVCSTHYTLNCSTTTGIKTIILLIPPFRHSITNSTMLCFWNMFSKYDDDEPSEPSLIYNLFTFRPRIFPRYNKLISQNYEVLFTVCTLYASMNVNIWSVYHCNS